MCVCVCVCVCVCICIYMCIWGGAFGCVYISISTYTNMHRCILYIGYPYPPPLANSLRCFFRGMPLICIDVYYILVTPNPPRTPLGACPEGGFVD